MRAGKWLHPAGPVCQIKPVGDQALLAIFGNRIDESVNEAVIALEQQVRAAGIAGVLETVPSYGSLLICYDPIRTDYETLTPYIRRLADRLQTGQQKQGRLVEIPVCYGGIYGEDLPFVASHAGISEQEVIALHSGRNYRIFMLGFLPGFPYLGGLDARLAAPRLKSPRSRIPAGSVGIGGEQTGIYPMDSPGGWQLIGRTPLSLYRPDSGDAEGGIPYEAGDWIRFVPISQEEFQSIKEKQEGR
ncbi:MAG: 5-oxoprolinase subunit PxpB [Lachnospiraceae bacterium]|nr:5-oxoprolinase subunit PxpB [Lachnospiraceae bacterium]